MDEKESRVKVKDLVKGESGILLGTFTKEIKPGRSGEWALVRITDNTGTAFARVWNNLPIFPVVKELADNDLVEAQVTCTENGQYINVELTSIVKSEQEIELLVDLEGLKAELRKSLNEMKDKELRAFVLSVFNREDVKEPFFHAPASQKSGYSFEGGLLAKVVRLIRLVKVVSNTYAEWNHNTDKFTSKLNEDLLVTASILHNIGKIFALRINGQKVDKTDLGELFEDSYLTMRVLLEELHKSSLPDEQKMVLEHVLGSSKGKQNFGALFIPRSREAMAFHLIESLDVQMSNFEFLDRNAGADQSFVQLFQKTMFLGTFDE